MHDFMDSLNKFWPYILAIVGLITRSVQQEARLKHVEENLKAEVDIMHKRMEEEAKRTLEQYNKADGKMEKLWEKMDQVFTLLMTMSNTTSEIKGKVDAINHPKEK